MRAATTVIFGLGLLGCAVDEREGGGKDTLPKRGVVATDPTIIAATATCGASSSGFDSVGISVTASDMGGNTNLGTCQVKIAGASEVGEFNSSNGTCYAIFENTACNASSSFIVDLVIANESGGFTTASLTIRP